MGLDYVIQYRKGGQRKYCGFVIQYRKGKENIVADALSRREEEGACKAITAVVPDWVKEVTESYDKSEWIKSV